MTLRRFERAGVLAIEPSALGLEFLIAGPAEPFELRGTTAIVDVKGPLTFEPGIFSCSYRDVRSRVERALASEATTVVLRFSSPGGDVWGSFDTARALRAAATASGKRLVAFVEGQACSAAYALACVCDEIVSSDTAVIGSIGVIACSVEMSEANARAGLRFSVLTSGARKADGHPAVPVTDETLGAMQSTVDAMAAVFFAHVAKHRADCPDPQALEASTYVGAAAIEPGLADRIATFDELLAELNSGVEAPSNKDSENASDTGGGVTHSAMAKKASDPVREALVAAIGDDSDKAKCNRAKRALEAYDNEEKPEASEDADEPAPEPKPEPKPDAAAQASDDEEKKPEAAADEDKPGAKAVSASELAKAVADELGARAKAEAVATAAAQARAELYSAYALPEGNALRAKLDGLSVKDATEILASFPKPKAPFANPHVAQPRAVQGSGQSAPATDPAAKAALDRAFNVNSCAPHVKHDGQTSVFSVVKGDQ